MPCAGLRLLALRQFQALLASSARPACASSFCFRSILGLAALWLTGQSSRPAFGGRLTLFVSPFIFRFMQASIYSSGSPISKVSPLGFCRVPGFAFGRCASFKSFWPPALVQQAPPAIIFQAVRRLGGALFFRGLRPSSIWGFPFWLLGLTGQSSRPAFGGRLTFVR